MLNGPKIIVGIPAYNTKKTVEITYRAICREIVDELILVDDASRDQTAQLAHDLDIQTIVHPWNLGYETTYPN